MYSIYRLNSAYYYKQMIDFFFYIERNKSLTRLGPNPMSVASKRYWLIVNTTLIIVLTIMVIEIIYPMRVTFVFF